MKIDSSPYPLTTFLRCQLCGKEDEDICCFEMWQECDDFDCNDSENLKCKQLEGPAIKCLGFETKEG